MNLDHSGTTKPDEVPETARVKISEDSSAKRSKAIASVGETSKGTSSALVDGSCDHSYRKSGKLRKSM